MGTNPVVDIYITLLKQISIDAKHIYIQY